MSSLGVVVDRLRSLLSGSDSGDRTVAIACQGGGSHAAFTAGALGRLLDDFPDGYRLVGLSGASGGAVSATAAWYGYLADGETPSDVLSAVWDDIAASTGWELWVNELTLLKARTPDAATPSVSPYSNPGSDWGRTQLEATLTDHVDFDAFETLVSPSAPDLLVSSVDVLGGDAVVFENGAVTPAAVVASAAVPQLFEAVEIDGDYHWDGFLSQNPPVRELAVSTSRPPVDELWVIRLTPKRTSSLPTGGDAIEERTQQLVENLSLTQELRFVETVNEWIDDDIVTGDSLTETTVRSIDLYREQTETSRLNRRSSFVDDLYADGRAEAANFRRELDSA